MRVERQLFDSRVARRVFGSFLLASLVPLLLFSWLALDRVGAALEQNAVERLNALARNYGQITLDKLAAVAESLAAFEPAGTGESLEISGINAVSVIDAGGERVVYGDWPGSRAGVAVGSAPVVVVASGELIVARRLEAATVYGRVAPEYLEGTNGLLDRGVDVCLFGTADLVTNPFYCSSSLPEAARDALRHHGHLSRGTETLTYEADGKQWLAADWQLFLPSRFEAQPWLVLVSQERGVALEAAGALESVIPQMALATLALIVILAMRQIRRTLTPIRALLAGTHRIAARDFHTPVEIATRDEFATLGTALNGMAGQLDQQFAALRALADIDRLILESPQIDPVLATLFARLGQLIPGAGHGALLIDADDPSHGLLYRLENTGSLAMERVALTQACHERLAAAGAGAYLSGAELAAVGLASAAASAGERVFVTPLTPAAPVPGVLLTRTQGDAPLSERERASLTELAARVAVASAAIKREAELFRRAHYDALTGLPNRQLLHDRLHQAVAQAEQQSRAIAVLFIDLDSFKTINDSLGHPSGDELLKQTSDRFASVLRETDTVARLGGDEYAIVLPHIHGPLEAEAVAIKVIEALRRPYLLDDHEAFVSASVGISLFPNDGRSATELLRKADMAMYSAKDAGKGCYRFFDDDMDLRIHERHALHGDLRNALAGGELFLMYQPQREMRSGRHPAVEALLRWRHPQRGLVSPAVFVPILEETGLIDEVGTWVLRQALSDFAAWQRVGLPLEHVAVNVSVRQLLDPNFVDIVTTALGEAQVDGRHLEIELTEAVLVKDFRTANDALTRLQALGVRIAVDDFGTGYSSLAYLNELAFDVLKIDRAFVVNLSAQRAVAIVRAIIAVADSLGKQVVAEGVETESQFSKLAALGCDYAQGFLLSKPLSKAELVAFIATEPTLTTLALDERAPPTARAAG